MTSAHPPASLLKGLEERLADDLLWLNMPAKSWIPPRQVDGRDVLDVAVVGAGLCGLTTLFALRRAAILNVACFDRAPQGAEGPWLTYARMPVLRTRKESQGLALGVPSLTFRAWFEAQFGRQAFIDMPAIPRDMWMAYMVWYRNVLDLPVENDTDVCNIRLTSDGLVEFDAVTAGKSRTLLARRLVLATGIDGMGGAALPLIARSVPAAYIAHASDDIDIEGLRGKRVAVVGLAASALDNAAAALEAGAARVDIFARRPSFPRVDKFSGIAGPGMIHGYVDLPDAVKWQLSVAGERNAVPPPRHSVLRVSAHANAHFHFGSPVQALKETGGAIEIVTPKGRYGADLVIFATGFRVDHTKAPELAALSDRIAMWQDHFRPEPEWERQDLGRYPYLGRHFQFLPKPGREVTDAAISHIHCFTFPAVMSHGKITSGVPSVGEGASRLVEGLASSLFVEDRDRHLEAFHGFSRPSLSGDEWTDADAAVAPSRETPLVA
ncbi:FAD-dependent oxidoreductase [Neorhizobium sp. NPDC001467]|uniref:FAD-dependent oxidoreductase n=1 Tax=Neorhizobium sp. NPDC001467 TaxID=3390595 RepID=UPI003D02FECB